MKRPLRPSQTWRDVELGIAHHPTTISRNNTAVDKSATDLLACCKHQVKPPGTGVKANFAVARSMACVDKRQVPERRIVTQGKACLFRRDQRVQFGETIAMPTQPGAFARMNHWPQRGTRHTQRHRQVKSQDSATVIWVTGQYPLKHRLDHRSSSQQDDRDARMPTGQLRRHRRGVQHLMRRFMVE